MPKPAWDDLDAFLNTDEFAVAATVRLQDGGARVVRGIFDDPYLDAQLGEYVADTSAPRFTCKASDAAGVRRGDWIAIDGTTYNVMTKPQNDGTGMVILRLEP